LKLEPLRAKDLHFETVKCASCRLAQYDNRLKCRRCHTLLHPEKESVAVGPLSVADLPVLAVAAPIPEITYGLSMQVAIRLLRLASGMSQKTLADRYGVNRTYISKIEVGFCSPTVPAIYRFAAALDTTAYKLVRLAELIKLGGFDAAKMRHRYDEPLVCGHGQEPSDADDA